MGCRIFHRNIFQHASHITSQPLEFQISRKEIDMKKMLIATLAVSSLAVAAPALHAQDQSGASATPTPPKVLVIVREAVKLAKDSDHEKNEAAYAQALIAAKAPERYLAVEAVTGPDVALFFNGYDSFDDAHKAHTFIEEHPALKAQLDRINDKDADYTSEATVSLATYNEKWSYNPNVNVGESRFFEIETIQVRTGRRKEWEDLVNAYKEAAAKAGVKDSYIFFELQYGGPTDTVLIFTPKKSFSDLDGEMATGQAFDAALGESGQKRLAQLSEESIASDRIDLYAFSPAMSVPPDDWVKEAPDYWKPKPMGATKAAPAAKKPAAAAAPKP
jgi:hypothetical protein